MIKKLLSIALVSTSILANAQTFTTTCTFALMTPSVGMVDPTTTPTVTGLTIGTFSAVGTNTAASTSGVFSFAGWDLGSPSSSVAASSYTGSINLNKYYGINFVPNSGTSLTIDSITFKVGRSATGPVNWSWRSSADAFATNLNCAVRNSTTMNTPSTGLFACNTPSFAFSTPQNGCVVIGGTSLTALTSATEFRMYLWNAAGTAGSLRIDDATFYGSTSLTTVLGTITSNLNSNFNVYPVPNNDGVVYIENKGNTDVSKIEVVDVLGNVVSTTLAISTKTALDLSTVANGTYMVRIYSNNTVTTQKIVVSK